METDYAMIKSSPNKTNEKKLINEAERLVREVEKSYDEKTDSRLF